MLALGPENVYFDVGDVVPGVDFRHRIRDAIERSSLFVLVIGPGFLERDEQGQRRIDRSNDVVRFEIRSALDRSTVRAADSPVAGVWRQSLAERVSSASAARSCRAPSNFLKISLPSLTGCSPRAPTWRPWLTT